MDNAQPGQHDFVGTYLAIARSKGTGTLKVFSAEQAKQLFFVDGFVSEIDTCRDDTVLEAALLHTEQFSDRDLKKAQKAAARGTKTLGAALLELNKVDEDTVQGTLREQIAAEVCELFEWDIETAEYVEHASDERLEDFVCELGEYYEIYTDAEELFIEGARLQDNWDLLETHFGVLRDVFYATPASTQYFHAREEHPFEHAIVSAVDSVRDTTELIEVCRLDPYECLQTVRRMHAGGELELINPVQMYQLGLERADARDLEKAFRLFHRAQERGLDDFDLQLRIAQILENLGRDLEATDRYLQFAHKCREQERLEEAARALRRALHITPDRLDVREDLLELLIELHRPEETRAEAIDTAERLAGIGEVSKALALLIQVREKFSTDLRLQQMIVQIAEQTGNAQCIEEERRLLAKEFDLSKNTDAALETYQRLFCEGQDTTEVRLKLVELHRQHGNQKKALEHAHGLLSLSKKRRIRDEKLLEELHQTVRELAPTDFRSNLWLAEHALRNEDTQGALAVLTSWVHVLAESDPENHEIVTAYHKLLSVDDRLDHHWGLVEALDRLDRRKEARRELQTIVELSVERGDAVHEERAVDQMLALEPYDLEAHCARVESRCRNNETSTSPFAREAAWLALLKVDVEAALTVAPRLPGDSSIDGVILYRVGLLAKDRGRHEEALKHLLSSARLHLEARNYGLGEEAVTAVISLEPDHPEAQDMLGQLRPPAAAPQPDTAAAAAQPAPAQPHAAQPDSATPPASQDRETPAAENVEATLQSDPERKVVHAVGLPAAEPFQGTPAVKTTVSNITERLRRLKSGGAEPKGRGKVVKAAAAAEKLRALKDAGKGGGGSAVVAKTTALQSAASRLKALSAGDGATESSALSEASATSAGADALSADATPEPTGGDGGGQVSTTKKALGGAAARLAALRQGDGSNSSENADGGANTAEQVADATPEPTDGDGGGEVTTKKAKLGGAASRLAQLREQANA